MIAASNGEAHLWGRVLEADLCRVLDPQTNRVATRPGLHTDWAHTGYRNRGRTPEEGISKARMFVKP